MQVVNYHDWPERSLQYLCRSYDSLNRGEDYLSSKTAIQIGILDYILFPGRSSLRDSYRLMNAETHKPYSDKLQLYTLCLPLVGSPGQEDIDYHTDVWARFFRAKTWEEIKMVAEKDEGIASAAVTVSELEEDPFTRLQALAREDILRRERTTQKQLAQLKDLKKRLHEEEEKLKAEKERVEAEKERADSEKERADALEREVERLRAELAQKV